MKIEARQRTYAFSRPFKIASHTYLDAAVIEVTLDHDGFVGRGEAAGVDYLGETCATMLKQISDISGRIEREPEAKRGWLQVALPPGGARNAVDCALWDLEAKMQRARRGAGTGQASKAVETYITIGLDTPDVMAEDATAFGPGARIKVKLGGLHDRECLRAVRSAAPHASLIVDVNQAWSYDQLIAMEDTLLAADVLLVEQPLAVGTDERLRDYEGDLSLCADESCHDRRDLSALVGKYGFVNVKLDKTGGLTEALALAHAAKAMGLGLMVGCMGGSSLGIAPALIVAQQCQFIDLDCPLQLQCDIADGLCFSGHRIAPSSPQLWG